MNTTLIQFFTFDCCLLAISFRKRREAIKGAKLELRTVETRKQVASKAEVVGGGHGKALNVAHRSAWLRGFTKKKNTQQRQTSSSGGDGQTAAILSRVFDWSDNNRLVGCKRRNISAGKHADFCTLLTHSYNARSCKMRITLRVFWNETFLTNVFVRQIYYIIKKSWHFNQSLAKDAFCCRCTNTRAWSFTVVFFCVCIRVCSSKCKLLTLI